ncbi:MAG: hypothetical protein WBC05_02025, partial [Sedimentisphaerales bacterium]
ATGDNNTGRRALVKHKWDRVLVTTRFVVEPTQMLDLTFLNSTKHIELGGDIICTLRRNMTLSYWRPEKGQ